MLFATCEWHPTCFTEGMLGVTPGTAIAEEVVRRTVEAVSTRGDVERVLRDVAYHERLRLAHANAHRTAAARRDDGEFLTDLQHALSRGALAAGDGLLNRVVRHYAFEIAGNFDDRVYGLATSVLPIALNGLLTSSSLVPRGTLGLRRLKLTDRVVVSGETEQLVRLAKMGTVVLAPTHCSNLDSPVLGLAIHRLGLPPFAYGAGLNLFTNPVMSFFMHNLGAYTVDRSKSAPLYREILKEYATVSLEHGQHNLFFPGGTRARSGGIESHLKRGLLGTTLAAFRNNLQRGRANPRIFIVPCCLSYPLVLEASSLIEEHLERAGKSRYVPPEPDESDRVERWRAFFKSLLRLDLEVDVRVGAALDPFGLHVDASGNSRDPRGRIVDPTGYLLRDGELVADATRDHEYTHQLANALLTSYPRLMVAHATHIVAFALFRRLRRASAEGADLYRFLRTLGPWSTVSVNALLRDIAGVLDALRREEISIRPNNADPSQVLDSALRIFGSYHREPVLVRQADHVTVGDASLLYFYRNRLASLTLDASF